MFIYIKSVWFVYSIQRTWEGKKGHVNPCPVDKIKIHVLVQNYHFSGWCAKNQRGHGAGNVETACQDAVVPQRMGLERADTQNRKCSFLLLLTIYSGCFVYFSGFLIAFSSQFFLVLPSFQIFSFTVFEISHMGKLYNVYIQASQCYVCPIISS